MKLLAFALSAFLLAVSAASAKERAEITLTYQVAPTRELPHGLNAVAVIDAAVRADEEDAARREHRWSSLAADMIESMLINADDGSNPDGATLTVVDRRNMAAVLKEHDLRAAGIVGGETAQQLGQILDVQGLILSRIQIDIIEEESRSRSVDWGQFLTGAVAASNGRSGGYDDGPPFGGRGRGRRGPAPVYEEDEVVEISRHLTVRCSFRLLDAVTGRTLYSHDPPPYRKTDKSSPVFMFGTVIHEEELNPLDHFIGELVERAAREFVGKLVPVTLEMKVTVIGKGKQGEAGVRALRSGDYESARDLLKQAIVKDPDDHENIFALGVTFELLGRPENALYCYQRAAGHEEANEEEAGDYIAARDRVAAYVAQMDTPNDEPPPAESNVREEDAAEGEPAQPEPGGQGDDSPDDETDDE